MTDENFVPYYETFGMYLARQKDRGDPIGDLAQNFLRDPPMAEPVTWQVMAAHVGMRGGDQIALRWAKGEYLAMDQAMKEYEAEELGVDFDK
tara:strand:- start:401 stop:676 length:276 start_codon:yes stop_codon:yes gene_type:complete